MVYNLFMIEIVQTDEFAKWLRRIKNHAARAWILVRIQRLVVTGDFGEAKSVGGGVLKMRIDRGPSYRLYYALRATELVLFLIGGDK